MNSVYAKGLGNPNPAGQSRIVNIEKPEVQKKLKELKAGQSVVVTYTDLLEVKKAEY